MAIKRSYLSSSSFDKCKFFPGSNGGNVLIKSCRWNTNKLDNLFCQMSHDMTKSTKWLCAQRRLRSACASTQSDQSLHCLPRRKLGSLAVCWAHSEDSDQTGMPRLIWVFAGHTLILLVLSCHGSNALNRAVKMFESRRTNSGRMP